MLCRMCVIFGVVLVGRLDLCVCFWVLLCVLYVYV